MPSRPLVRSFFVLWWTLGVLLCYWSVQTAQHAVASHTRSGVHVALLGGLEAISALLFLLPRTLRAGAVGLLFTFGVAFVFHAAHFEFRGELLLFAAAVIFVAVHGPVPLRWVKAGASR